MSAQTRAAAPRLSAVAEVREALRLDWRSVEPGSVTPLLVMLPLLTALAVWSDWSSALGTLVLVWGLMIALQPWTAEDKKGSPRLHLAAGLTRHGIVTARYVWAGGSVLALAIGASLSLVLSAALLGRPMGESFAQIWMFTALVTIVLGVGIPIRISRGPVLSFVAMVLAAIAVMGAVLALITLVPLGPDPSALEFVAAAAGVLLLLNVIALPLSYLGAQRAYARKDL